MIRQSFPDNANRIYVYNLDKWQINGNIFLININNNHFIVCSSGRDQIFYLNLCLVPTIITLVEKQEVSLATIY